MLRVCKESLTANKSKEQPELSELLNAAKIVGDTFISKDILPVEIFIR
jgi:hypothetical protein